jgi:hypothetical protein
VTHVSSRRNATQRICRHDKVEQVDAGNDSEKALTSRFMLGSRLTSEAQGRRQP